jgi:integrase
MARRSQPHYWKSRDAWYATIRGKQIRLATGKDAKQEAWAEFHRAITDAGLDKPGVAPRIAVRTLCGLFLDHVKVDRKPRTYDWYRRHLKSFVAAHGERIAADVRPYHVADWAGSHGWGPSNRSGAITAVKAAFSWARKMGHLETDPVKDMSKPPPVRREKIISGEQSDRVLGGVSARFALLLEFLRESGARPGEGAALTAADVDWGRGVATLREHKTDGSTTKPRVIVLSARAREILQAQAGENPAGALFRNARGNPWSRNAMACAFRRLREKTGMGKEATAQAFRHRFATDAARQLPNTVVAALLGHKSTAMVDRVYTHIGDEVDTLKDALEKVRPGGPKPSDQK